MSTPILDLVIKGAAIGSASSTLNLSATTLTFAANAVAWAAVNKTGSSLADLTTRTFLQLSDSPADFTGAGGKIVKVNAGATALEFVAAGAGVSAFPDLSDVPSTYVGAGGYILAVNSGATAVEFLATLAWAKVSKTGSSLADLATRSADDITSGTVAVARLPVMTGANGSTGGTAGLVPAPAAADNVKFLRGDGTFAAGASATLPALIRAVAVSYASSVAPDAGATDVLNIGALTGAITIAAPTGTPADGQKLTLRMRQDATGGRVVTWNASYAFGADVAEALIPSAASAAWEICFQYHSTASKWRAVALARGF